MYTGTGIDDTADHAVDEISQRRKWNRKTTNN